MDHSFGGSGPGCLCPVCLALHRIGQVLLGEGQSLDFKTRGYIRLRQFQVALLDESEVDKRQQGAEKGALPPVPARVVEIHKHTYPEVGPPGEFGDPPGAGEASGSKDKPKGKKEEIAHKKDKKEKDRKDKKDKKVKKDRSPHYSKQAPSRERASPPTTTPEKRESEPTSTKKGDKRSASPTDLKTWEVQQSRERFVDPKEALKASGAKSKAQKTKQEESPIPEEYTEESSEAEEAEAIVEEEEPEDRAEEAKPSRREHHKHHRAPRSPSRSPPRHRDERAPLRRRTTSGRNPPRWGKNRGVGKYKRNQEVRELGWEGFHAAKKAQKTSRRSWKRG